jgi:hypothetical protein
LISNVYSPKKWQIFKDGFQSSLYHAVAPVEQRTLVVANVVFEFGSLGTGAAVSACEFFHF